MERKWRCVSCSHPNWSAAPHCASCYKPRKEDDFNAIPLQNSSRLCDDNIIIHQTSPSRCRKGKTNLLGGSYGGAVRESTSGRWVCGECSSENVNNSRECFRCKSTRPKKLAGGAQSSGAAQFGDNTADSWPQSRPRRKSRRPHHARDKRSTSGVATVAVPPGTGSGQASLSASPLPPQQDVGVAKPKWSCTVCTFENWPRTVRCAMCLTPRNGPGSGTSGPTVGPSSSSGDNHSQSSSGGEGDSADVSSECRLNSEQSTNSVATTLNLSDEIISCQSGPSTAEASRSSPSSTCGTSELDGVGGRSGRGRQRASSPPEAIAQRLNRMSHRDTLFLAACTGVASGDVNAVHQYILDGGEYTRGLTAEEASLLNSSQRKKQSNGQRVGRRFDAGETLVHLSLGFGRSELLAVLLPGADEHRVRKRLPSYAHQVVADEVRDEVSRCMQQLKGVWPCYVVTRDCLFSLPEEISSFSQPIQDQLLQDVVDGEVQKELEESDPPVINWCNLITQSLGTKLYALWNRTQGDCLLDSVLQATWGVQDRSASLRIALAESLKDGKTRFYERWRDAEILQAHSLQYSVDEVQWRSDFAQLQHRASSPGASLEQLHIFALAHILRRPIVVYGIKFVKSFRGDNLGLARFQGVYLPLLWDPEFCWCSPLTLAYTRGHFSALVPLENLLTPKSPTEVLREPHPSSSFPSGSSSSSQPRSSHSVSPPSHAISDASGGVSWLPLVDAHNELLPVHFLTMEEMGREEELLHRWLDCFAFNGCRLAARQVMPREHHLVESLVDSWLSRYRRLEARESSPVEASCSVDGLAAAVDHL
eukprot:scpid31501/ scgid14008/ Ubiquitin thioesterase Zranb1; Zinc finger Ran-binding domain-containing protein 1